MRQHEQMKPSSQLQKERQTKRLIWMLSLCLVIVFFVSVNSGPIRLAPKDLFMTLIGQGTVQQTLILFDFRLPRIVLAVLVGSGLAVAGTVLQSVVRNPLADPGIIGINAGAGLAVMLFISFYEKFVNVPVYLMPLLAFIGASLTAIVIYVLSYKRGEGVQPIRLVLTGVAMAAGVNALMIVFTLKLNPDHYQLMATWLAGSIWGSNWQFVIALLPWILILIPFIYAKSSVLNILSLGDESAIGLGANLEKERRVLMFAAVALAAASVSVSGGIGFIGLIAPHLTRKLVGDKHEYVLPIAALVGAFLLIVADTIGKSTLLSSDIPAGVIVAVIGAPYFLYLLARLKE